MCLALFGWRSHPPYRLVLALNRDEFFWRRTEPLAELDRRGRRFAAGTDVSGGGSWLGADALGRFALVTNVRNGMPGRSTPAGNHRSRGALTVDYLAAEISAEAYATEVIAAADHYRPFNLVVGDSISAHHVTNVPHSHSSEIATGIHGLSNGGLDEAWPKVAGGLGDFATALSQDKGQASEAIDPYFDLLMNSEFADRDCLPETGISKSLERRLSGRFVKLGVYGTRSSTLVRISGESATEIVERRFNPLARRIGESQIWL